GAAATRVADALNFGLVLDLQFERAIDQLARASEDFERLFPLALRLVPFAKFGRELVVVGIHGGCRFKIRPGFIAAADVDEGISPEEIGCANQLQYWDDRCAFNGRRRVTRTGGAAISGVRTALSLETRDNLARF